MVTLSNSSRLPANTDPMVVNPVTFPPGRSIAKADGELPNAN